MYAERSEAKIFEKMIILGPKTAILGPQFCRSLVLGPHFWWSGGSGPRGSPESAPVSLPVLATSEEVLPDSMHFPLAKVLYVISMDFIMSID